MKQGHLLLQHQFHFCSVFHEKKKLKLRQTTTTRISLSLRPPFRSLAGGRFKWVHKCDFSRVCWIPMKRAIIAHKKLQLEICQNVLLHKFSKSAAKPFCAQSFSLLSVHANFYLLSANFKRWITKHSQCAYFSFGFLLKIINNVQFVPRFFCGRRY